MFAITGGGTGGHLAIAQSLGESIAKKGLESIYIGSLSGQDRAWFENSALFSHTYFLDSTGVVNKRGLGKLKAIFKQLSAVYKAYKILKSHKVRYVISVGGFSAGGASIASIFAKIPLFIHEQNAIKGKLNALLTPFAKIIFGSFKDKAKNFKLVDYPVREAFFTHARIRTECKHILFLGGSQGAIAINNFALHIAKDLQQRGIKIAHQCGERDFERVSKAYKALGLQDKVEVFAFDSNLVKRIEVADICIARSGASSLWELSANGLSAIFIPYPYAAGDHQYYNALSLADSSLCKVIREEALESSAVLEYIDSLDKATLEQYSKQLMDKIKPNGADRIIECILNA